MTHRQKVDHFIEDLRERGVGTSTAAPPLFRLLWALGLKVPPPLFLNFFTLTMLLGGAFAVLWGSFMWAFVSGHKWLFHPEHVSLEGYAVWVICTAGGGYAYGLCMAAYFRWKARRLRLPPWGSYPQPEGWDE
jgi:hypothetical protein